jgi:hypothetical protein
VKKRLPTGAHRIILTLKRYEIETPMTETPLDADQAAVALCDALAVPPIEPSADVIAQIVTSGAGAKIVSPEEAEQLNVENSLLRGTLWLTARSLKDYRAALHVKAGDPEMLELVVPATLPARADDALARADAMLRNQKGRQV